jgi:GT2 family glycosyltransferase
MTRLSAWIVNHDSGAFCLRCVESLLEEWRAAGRASDELEVIVVDSGSTQDESRWWKELRQLGARVVVRESNVGYARGMAVASAHSRGGPDDLVAVLNPDLYFLEGSIARLLDAFERDRELAVAGPRAFIDEARELYLPSQVPPTPLAELAELASHSWPSWARRRATDRTRRDLAHWTASVAHDEAMLSGACLFLRRTVLDQLDGLFDPRYPLYYEDADFARRVMRAGLRAQLIPDAQILHHWSRSAGSGEAFAGEPARRHAISRRLYQRRWYGRVTESLSTMLRGVLERRLAKRGPRPMHDFDDLGELVEAPLLEFSEPDALLEWSVTPNFSLAAGSLVDGSDVRLSARGWSWLFPGRYYLRAVRRKDLEVLGAWTFMKASPARAWPVDPEALVHDEPPRYRRVDGDEAH